MEPDTQPLPTPRSPAADLGFHQTEKLHRPACIRHPQEGLAGHQDVAPEERGRAGPRLALLGTTRGAARTYHLVSRMA